MGKWRKFGLAHLDAKLTLHLGGATTTLFLNSIIKLNSIG
jgi:hypothetical protein